MIAALSETAPLRAVLVKRPEDAFGSEAAIERSWRELAYTAPPDLDAARREHDAFVRLLEDAGAGVSFLATSPDTGLDSIYARDASIVTGDGAILCRMGKDARRGEPEAQAAAYEALGVPVIGRIEAPGTLEGGDYVWLDERTAAVGRGYRTNDEGIRQLRALLGPDVELVVVPLPHWRGPGDVFHLMSILSPIDEDLALVHSPLMPVPFRERLLGRGIELVEVPAEELDALGCNVLAVGPRRCVMADGSPVTRRRLEAAGAEVHVFVGREICLKGQGGPTCLTRPVARGGSERAPANMFRARIVAPHERPLDEWARRGRPPDASRLSIPPRRCTMAVFAVPLPTRISSPGGRSWASSTARARRTSRTSTVAMG